MKRLNLNPTGRTVYKISQPGVEAARQKFTIEPMRFLFPFEARHEAEAKCPTFCHHNHARDWLRRKAG
jgi:hypothetical protein